MYGRFTLEAIVATAFGRQVDIQKGESDQFCKAMEAALTEFVGGVLEKFILFNSELIHCIINNNLRSDKL